MLRIFITLIAHIIGFVGSIGQDSDMEIRGFNGDRPALRTYSTGHSGKVDKITEAGEELGITGILKEEGPKTEISACKGLN